MSISIRLVFGASDATSFNGANDNGDWGAPMPQLQSLTLEMGDIDYQPDNGSNSPAEKLGRTKSAGKPDDIVDEFMNGLKDYLAQQCMSFLSKFLGNPKQDENDSIEKPNSVSPNRRNNGSNDDLNTVGPSEPESKSKSKSKPDSDEETRTKEKRVNESTKPNTTESAAPEKTKTENAPVSGVKPTTMPDPTGTVTVDEPIVVKAGQTFDGGGKLYKAGPSLGDGGQSENQKPVFILEDGAVLKNAQIQGADGVHVNGDATVKDVWWRDVGEDALTKKGAGDVRIIGGGAFEAHDKIFQVNAGGSLHIEGFTADNFGRGVAQNGGTTFPLEVTIKNSKFTNGDELFRTDSPNAKITLDDVDLSNVNYDARGPRGMEVIGGRKVGYI